MIKKLVLKAPYFLAILFPTMIFSSKAGAQSFMVENNSKISAEISAKELTRISVSGDRITLIRGSEGAYQVSNDDLQGAVFIKPVVHSLNTHETCPVQKNKKQVHSKTHCQKDRGNTNPLKSFYLFVNTEQNRHYVLNLTPQSNRHADILVLKPVEFANDAARAWEVSDHYNQILIRLVEFILHQETPAGYVHTMLKKPKEFNFGKNCNLKLTDQYTGSRLSIEVYQLTNHSRQTITLSEKDLYQPEDRAIYLREKSLSPHQTVQLIKVVNHV